MLIYANHSMKKQSFVFILFTFLFLIVSASEKNNYRFRTFSPEGGFYYDGITGIQQDRDGFIWIMMDNDLYKFDGYQYKSLYSLFSELDEDGRWHFNSVAADKSGRIFVGTTNGLFHYNRITNKFDKLLKGNVSHLNIDNRNNVWVVQDKQSAIYDEGESSLNKLSYEGKDLLNVNSYMQDDEGMFLSSYNNIYRYNYHTQKVSSFFSFEKGLIIQKIKKSNNKMWVLVSNQGLFKIDIPTATIEKKYDFYYDNPKDKTLTRDLYIDKNGEVWIATQHGLYILNPVTEEYTRYLHSKSDPFSLTNNSVWQIMEDHQKNVWIGTYSGGLCYVNLDEKIRFNTFTTKETPLNHNLVSSFVEDEKYIWVATEGGGLNKIDKKTGAFSFLTNNPLDNNSLSFNNIKSIIADSQQNIWISMFRGGLDCYNKETQKFTHFKQEPNNENSLITNNLRKIVLENDSGIWIAYQLNRPVVSFFSFKDNKFTHYYLDDENDSHYIFDIYRGVNNQLWIMTHEKLYLMNTKTFEVEKIPYKGSSYLKAQTLCTDGSENVWIGTIGRGLIRYNIPTSEFTAYDEILKFNVTSIYSICTDDDNNLWMGTDNGLFKYSRNEDRFFRFDKKDGVQGQVFYPLAALKGKDGELYFGGTNGFTIVNPKELTQNKYTPKAFISEFFIDNQPANPYREESSVTDNYSFPEKIVLNHNEVNFGFRFSSDNYLVPEKNRFRYRLKGYDDRWIEVDASSRNAFYSKVPPGQYVFELIASNNDGIWNDEPTRMQIERLPAPWLSWQAYLLYTLLFAGIIYMIIRYYNQQKKLKLQLYLDKVDKEKKEEIHQSQLRFFTNISHDFRTPLSLIIAAVNKMREEGLKEYYYRILNGNSQRLLNLVNELMDFRTIENGKMPLQIESANVNDLVKQVAFDFNDYAQQRKINFHIDCDSDIPTSLFADKHILEKVMMNLLNNAFKYTSEGGSISINTFYNKGFKSDFTNSYTAKSESVLSNDYFSIVVKDTGIGITKDSIASVFERFYKVKTVNFDSHLGTGIGLALVKSLVLLHRGEISMYSEREKGTDIIVTFSANPDIYEKDDFIKNNIQERKTPTPNDIKEAPPEDLKLEDESENLLHDKKRILIVEDNDDLRTFIADSLSSEFEIIQAANGLIASNILDRDPIDLVLSDIMMPEKDGITLCKEVKENMQISHIPFILLTAKTGLDSQLEGADSGADMYFEKPIDSKLLLLTIRNIFTRQKQLKDYYMNNYFVDSSELSTNQQDKDFLRKFIEIVEKNIDQSEMDVNYIASELSISRAKLYNKVKALTGKSTVEFILGYRLRKAARLLIEEGLSVKEVIEQIGIESQSYFTHAFKKEFGETPTSFAAKHKKK